MVRLDLRCNGTKLNERKQPMNARYVRTILTLALVAATALAPVAPAFGRTQDSPASAAAQAPSSAPPQVQAPGQPPAPTSAGAPAAEPAAAPQPAAPPAPIPQRTMLESSPNFTHGRRAFPNILGPYMPPNVAQADLTNSQRLAQMVHDGKIELSLQDAVELALENNLDIAIQRYDPWIAETNVLAAKGGRGYAMGDLPSPLFDPLLTANVSVNDNNQPVENPFLTGSGLGLTTYTSHSTTTSIEYQQGFATGTSITAQSYTTRQSSTSTVSVFNPSVESVIGFSFTQQLLNGFGIGVNNRSIHITKIDKQIADSAFEQQVITSVTAVADAYWELAYARDSITVGEEALKEAQQLYDDNKKEVDIGTLAPLDLVQAEAQVAQAQQTLINDQTLQLQDQTALLNLIVKDVTDPALITAEIVPTDSLQPSTDQPVPELADALKEALTNRPDVQQANLTIKVADVNVHATHNALLPTLSVTGGYESIGLAGNSTSSVSTVTSEGPDLAVPILDAHGNPVLDTATGLPIYVSEITGESTTSSTLHSGFSNALSEAFHNRFPEYSAQFNLSIPIRNREAQADSAYAQLTERQDEARMRQTENNVLVDVRNAIIELVQDRAAVNAATKTRILDQETLDAEQKKLKLGASTIFTVVTDQSTLASAASAEVRALANLEEAQINFDRAMARTLDVNHITIADAQTGVVPRDTLIPGTTASGTLAADPSAAQSAQSAGAAETSSSSAGASDAGASGIAMDIPSGPGGKQSDSMLDISRGN
jgi:outer membrane protein TolC